MCLFSVWVTQLSNCFIAPSISHFLALPTSRTFHCRLLLGFPCLFQNLYLELRWHIPRQSIIMGLDVIRIYKNGKHHSWLQSSIHSLLILSSLFWVTCGLISLWVSVRFSWGMELVYSLMLSSDEAPNTAFLTDKSPNSTNTLHDVKNKWSVRILAGKHMEHP